VTKLDIPTKTTHYSGLCRKSGITPHRAGHIGTAIFGTATSLLTNSARHKWALELTADNVAVPTTVTLC